MLDFCRFRPPSLLFNDRLTTLVCALSLLDALPISSSVRLKPLNCSRLPCVYAQETLTYTQGKREQFSGFNRSEERFSRNAETELVCRLLVEKKNDSGAREKDENDFGYH